MEQWKIHRDRNACTKPGCPLPTAEEFFAVLELPDCQRHDLCAMCFQQMEQETDSQPIYWKARRKIGDKKGPTLDLVSLRVLFDRLGEVEDIAAAAVYLASDAGSYVTGRVIDVDGGARASNLDMGIPDLE